MHACIKLISIQAADNCHNYYIRSSATQLQYFLKLRKRKECFKQTLLLMLHYTPDDKLTLNATCNDPDLRKNFRDIRCHLNVQGTGDCVHIYEYNPESWSKNTSQIITQEEGKVQSNLIIMEALELWRLLMWLYTFVVRQKNIMTGWAIIDRASSLIVSCGNWKIYMKLDFDGTSKEIGYGCTIPTMKPWAFLLMNIKAMPWAQKPYDLDLDVD